MNYKLLMPLSAAMLLTACVIEPTEWDKESRYEERAYQALNLIDSAQTMRIALHPNQWGERESAWYMSEHPSMFTAGAFGLIKAFGHAEATQALYDNDAPPWLIRGWQVITIGDVAQAVYGNYRAGLSFGF